MKLYWLLLACLGASLAAPQPQIQVKKVSPRALLDDALEFVSLLPIDDLLAILQDHVDNDPAVAYVMTYMRSDEWNLLLNIVITMPTAEDFIEYLDNAGIPFEYIIYTGHKFINDVILGVDPDETASLRSFLDEIQAALPADDIVALVKDKMQNSPDFQDFYTLIASEKGRVLVSEILLMKEPIRIQEQLTAMGVDVAGALKALYEFFGWGEPPK